MLEAWIVDEAIISIFPVDDDGSPITSTPVWLGRVATGLKISHRAIGVVDHPTGAPYGIRHIVDEEHQIQLDRTWVTDVPGVTPPGGDIGVAIANGANPGNGIDYTLQRDKQYILTIVWQNAEDPNRFYYRVYYGVTDVSHDVDATGGADSAFESAITWAAQYYL